MKIECAEASCSRIIDGTDNSNIHLDVYDQELFRKQCYYVSKLFHNKIKAKKVVAIINKDKHEERPDLAWKEIKELFTSSEVSSSFARQILSAIEMLRIG